MPLCGGSNFSLDLLKLTKGEYMHMINTKKYLAPRRIDLFSEFGQDLDKVFNEVFGAPFLNGKKSKGYPIMDAVRTQDSLVLQYTVPGVKLEDLSVEVSNDEQGRLLTVSGRLSNDYTYQESNYQIRELSSQEFRRVIRLPEDLLDEEPKAILKDGILKLTFNTNLAEPEPSIKKLKIKSE
jgi:HSP20 family protein